MSALMGCRHRRRKANRCLCLCMSAPLGVTDQVRSPELAGGDLVILGESRRAGTRPPELVRADLALGGEKPVQECGVHHAAEPDLAVDQYHRHLGVVPRDELGVGVNVDQIESEAEPLLRFVEHLDRLVAATALRAGVDRHGQMFGPWCSMQQPRE
jgi:hypothetical protein